VSAATLVAPTPEPRAIPAEGRFIPGTLLAGRYRLVALLGRGGMGEVYRAEDTRLGQAVALKFLPDSVARDAAVLERFYAEVRIGRQVSHPNVCRLYDLVEVDGHHCLSMEYVDGEDLSALLSRIGRLPADKAVEIARDLCAGLAAAHDKGVIHRDLKPANIMIDGKGRARIADFGIAALADDIDSQDFAGTPAYLAPELLDGKPASIRSDLYALGLVLYEACTGKRLFDARSLAELKSLQQATEPPSLSSSARDIPPALERLVLRCLDRDPEARPASAHAVMAALPGGDPLQAAMAAGETPSPAMVAAAGKTGELRPAPAWGWLASAVLGLFLLAWLSAQSTLIGRVAPEKSPEVLAEKATAILASLGYAERPQDSHGVFTLDGEFLNHVRDQGESPRRWDNLDRAQPGPLQFLYRQSPGELVAQRSLMRGFGPGEAGRVTESDPPTNQPGMIDVRLDREGRLLALHVVAVPRSPVGDGKAPDWQPLFAAAGLAPADLKPALPVVAAAVAADHWAAWTGTYAGQPGVEFRIEAAALRGKPVWFEIRGPWTRPGADELGAPLRIAIATVLGASLFMWVTIGVLVRRNLRLGRSDLPGARRLVGFLLATTLVSQMLRADHVAMLLEETNLMANIAAQVVLYGVIIWLLYVALEPIARRRWPQLLVGWTRLVSGRWRDPLVGRDLLVGCVAGIALALVLHLAIVAPAWGELPAPVPRGRVFSTLSDFRHLLHFMLWSPFAAVTIGFGTLLGLLIYRAILRKAWLAVVLQGVALYFGFAAFTGIEEVWSLAGALFTAIYLLVALRAGILAAVVGFYVFLVLEATPLTLDFSLWHADRTLATMALVLALAAFGFWHSLGGKSPLGGTLFDRDD
jgi:serine/threonine-protein kinase